MKTKSTSSLAVAIEKFYAFLEQPLYLSARVALVILVFPLVMSFMFPLWRISMEAPQYPKGLYMEIYSYKIDGGNHGQHIQEINTLNHYIGMQRIDKAALADLDWIPFALGVLAILALRVAAIGNVRALLDLFVLSSYAAAFSFARFVYRLYVFGHDLDPHAPITVEPFTPALIGSKQIANFTTHSMPQQGTFLVMVFTIGVAIISVWHLIAGRRLSLRESHTHALH